MENTKYAIGLSGFMIDTAIVISGYIRLVFLSFDLSRRSALRGLICVLCCFLLQGLLNTLSAQTTTIKLSSIYKKSSTAKHSKAANSRLVQGKLLIANSNCLSCHRTDIKLIGPAFKDIAVRYSAVKGNTKLLAQKVIAGGSGNWGELTMSPHPEIALDKASKMVDYILSIK